MNCPTIFDACVPRRDVTDGSFTEADFAADLASVLKKTAPDEYRKPEKFFAQTYPTEGLKTLLKSVCSRLSGSGESISPIFRLDTTYGGGKTHALIALAHAANGLQGVQNAEEFLSPEHIPQGHVRVAAFDGENADPNNGRPLEDGIRAYTPWGEIAYFLAGAKGYELVRRSDESHGAPGAETIQQLFGDEPTLILIDELSVYLRKLAQGSAREAGGQLTAFLTALFKAVESTPRAAVVYTLAVGKQRVATDAYREENQYIADAMAEAEAVSARKATLLDPTEEDETVRVLVRRLFEQVDEEKAAKVVACYRDLWTRHREWLPEDSLGEQRVNAFASGYPFHPELIETLRNKTATLNNFQRVRGMLRILGQSIRRLWQQQPKDAHALHLHHIDPGFDPIRKEVTTRLGLGQFLPALRSDVAAIEGEQPALAQQLDTKHYVGLAAYGSHVGRTIFLHSLAFNEQLKGASKEKIRYAVLSPATEVSFIDDAVTHFQQESAYLDDRPTAPLRFQAEPNLTQIIQRQEGQVDPTEAGNHLNDRVKEIFAKGKTFNAIPFPGGPYEVPDDDGGGHPYLAIMHHDAAEVAPDRVEIPELVDRIYRTHGAGGDLRKNRNNIVFLLADRQRKAEMRRKIVYHLALKDLLHPSRLNELAEHQQNQMREKSRRSEQEVATAIQQCYRHVLYPSKDRIEGSELDLSHSAIEVHTASQTPGEGQKHIVQVLRESKKLRLPEDDPDNPTFIRDKTPLKKGQISTAALRTEFRRDPALPILVGDDVFIRAIRHGVENGHYIYKSGDLIWAKGQPDATVKIDEQSYIYTAQYAREHEIWPKPEPTPGAQPESTGASSITTTGGAEPGYGSDPESGSTGGTSPEPDASSPDGAPQAHTPDPGSGRREVTAEGPLKQALGELWHKAQSANIDTIGTLHLKLFDASDGFRVLGIASTISKATKYAWIEGEYETEQGSSLSLRFEGSGDDAAPIKDFLEPQLRAASDKDMSVQIQLTFTEGLDPNGSDPEKISEKLGRFGTGAAFVRATAAAAQGGAA
jgi:hypothetical protein